MSGSIPHDDYDTSGPLTDSELLARHTAGDPDAFGELVKRHRDRLWAVAVRTLGDREEAADALQDALISAFRAAHTFQGRSAVTTWLHRIVVNACLDRARRTATRRTTLLDDENQRADTLLGTDEAADAPVVRGELRRELALALDSLPTEQRSALVLVDMQGYPVAEAAEILGVPVGTVKSRCARGRARLLPLLKHLRAGSTEPRPGVDVVSRETSPGHTAPGHMAPGHTSVAVSRETSPGGNAHPAQMSPHPTDSGSQLERPQGGGFQDVGPGDGGRNLPGGGAVPGVSMAFPTEDLSAEGGAAPA